MASNPTSGGEVQTFLDQREILNYVGKLHKILFQVSLGKIDDLAAGESFPGLILQNARLLLRRLRSLLLVGLGELLLRRGLLLALLLCFLLDF